MAQFTNQATLVYNGQTVNSNVAVGEILDTLAITKTAVDNPYRSGDNVTYLINLVNSGTAPLTNITLSDNLGGYTFGTGTVYPLAYTPDSIRLFVDGVLQPAPTVTAGPPLTITGVNIPAGSNATVAYETTLTEFAPLETGSAINNTVTATGAGITNPALAAETISPAEAANLQITKSISPNPVTENGQVTYTFNIENTGNTPVTVADGAVVNDTFNPILTGITAALDGRTLTPTTEYTYNETTGQFSTVGGVITVPAATYTTDPTTGAVTTTPGQTTLTVTGTI